jgi:hypothetical protein
MRGAILPLLQYSFMAWCSVKKAQGQMYLYLYQAVKTYWGMDKHLHGFLKSALDGGEWSAPRSGRFIPKERAFHKILISSVLCPGCFVRPHFLSAYSLVSIQFYVEGLHFALVRFGQGITYFTRSFKYKFYYFSEKRLIMQNMTQVIKGGSN